MKKSTTVLLGLLLTLSAFGQKDIEFTLISPKTNTEVYVNKTFILTYSFKNVGTEWINADDSFFVSLKVDGQYIMGGFSKKYQPHSNIPPGDSVFFTTGFSFTETTPSPISFCFEYTSSYNGEVVDTNYANNESCATIKVSERSTTAIIPATPPAFALYPNPTAKCIFIETGLQTGTVLLSDVTGKQVDSFRLQQGAAVIAVDALDNGIYFCRLLSAQNEILGTQKIIINH